MPCEPLRADAPKREQVHFLRYYGSERVASYESPWLHHKNTIHFVWYFFVYFLFVFHRYMAIFGR